MPSFDSMGPAGLGPLTGGGRGYCAGAAPPPGQGHGRGRGRRNTYYATGLTRWQRDAQAVQASAQAAPSSATTDAVAGINQKLDEVLQRLERLEAERQS